MVRIIIEVPERDTSLHKFFEPIESRLGQNAGGAPNIISTAGTNEIMSRKPLDAMDGGPPAQPLLEVSKTITSNQLRVAAITDIDGGPAPGGSHQAFAERGSRPYP